MLCRNSTVDIWVKLREKQNLDPPRQEGSFVIVTKSLLTQFDQHQDEIREISSSSLETLLYLNTVVQKWIKEAKISYRAITFKEIPLVFIPNEKVDDLVNWIEDARLKHSQK